MSFVLETWTSDPQKKTHRTFRTKEEVRQSLREINVKRCTIFMAPVKFQVLVMAKDQVSCIIKNRLFPTNKLGYKPHHPEYWIGPPEKQEKPKEPRKKNRALEALERVVDNAITRS
jgi:hypothetical protein